MEERRPWYYWRRSDLEFLKEEEAYINSLESPADDEYHKPLIIEHLGESPRPHQPGQFIRSAVREIGLLKRMIYGIISPDDFYEIVRQPYEDEGGGFGKDE